MHPVGHVLDAEFFRHASPFDFLRVQTVEAGGEDLVPGGVGNEVSGDLLGDEVVVGLVLAEGLNDPIPPGPDVSVAVDLIPVGIGIARHVEPLRSHSFGVLIGIHQAVDDFPIGIFGSVGHEGIDLIDERGETRKVEGRPAQPADFVSLGAWLERGTVKGMGDEVVDFIVRARVLGLGNFNGLWEKPERPMAIVFPAFFDPLVEQILLLLRKRKLGFRRGHQLLGLVGPNAPVNLRILQASRRQPDHALMVFRCLFERIQAKVRFLILRIRAMTLEALVRQDRPDLAVEINF